MSPHTHTPFAGWRARASRLFTVLALACTTLAQAQIAFTDSLAGPSSPNLIVPADYTYVSQGLQRTGSAVYRSLVKSNNFTYLAQNKFTAEVTVNVALGDIAFVGLGQGVSNAAYGPNEPTNAFVFRIHNLSGYTQIDTAAAAGFVSNQFLQVGGIGNYTAGSNTTFRVTRDGDSITLSVPAQNISRTYSLSTYGASLGLTNSNTCFFFGSGNTGTRFTNVSVTVPPTVFASGISPVIAYDPIFPATAYANAAAASTPDPVVGYNANWVNPHPATVFPLGSHPWENTAPYNFQANWINAWNNLSSRGPGGQSWTKYTTTITGQGDFVLQFLADNASWIYIDGQLIGYQDWYWWLNGTGRYTIRLSGTGSHELCFIIWDGGGAAGGKFRLETTQSFTTNNPGAPLPPAPPATDTTAPVISAPANITTEATGPGGAAVTFSATATDNKDGAVAVVAAPASGSTFALGTTAVGLAASDAAGNTATASFDITVRDTTPPALGAATNVGPIEATSAAGAAATFSLPVATDIVDGNVTVTSSHTSGSTFALGTTSVSLSAVDRRGNNTSRSFTVTVVDTTAPAIDAPANIVAEATSASGATVSYSASATDIVDGSVAVSGSPTSGGMFPIGTTAVTLSSTDSRNNASTASFTITVRDTIAPALTVPANQVIEATSADGAIANFAASASDAVGVTALTTSVSSGSTFPIGTSTVGVTARDAAGNFTNGSFTITVVDTTAPTLVVPANQVIEATSAAGAVASFTPSATDAVGVTSLTTSVASGSTFALGTTTVVVTAKDAAGNATSGSFTVTVRDTTAPVIASLSNSAPTLWPPNHKMVAVTVSANVADLVGVTSLKIVNVTSSEPDNGLGDGDTAGDIQITGNLSVNLRAERSGSGNGRTYTITVEARDAAGNVSTRTTTAFVPKSQGK